VRELRVVGGGREVPPGISLGVRSGSLTGLHGPAAAARRRRCARSSRCSGRRSWSVGGMAVDVVVVVAVTFAALGLGALTLRRRTP
jgi:hypothetical protein